MTETSKSILITLTLKVTTVTMVGVHPCTYVTEDVNVCILDDGEEPNESNCWNEQNCRNRPRYNEVVNPEEVTSDSSTAIHVSSVALMTFLLFALNL